MYLPMVGRIPRSSHVQFHCWWLMAIIPIIPVAFGIFWLYQVIFYYYCGYDCVFPVSMILFNIPLFSPLIYVFFQWNSSHSVVFRIHISETPAASVKAFSSKVQRNSGYGWSSSWGSTGGRLRSQRGPSGCWEILGEILKLCPTFLGDASLWWFRYVEAVEALTENWPDLKLQYQYFAEPNMRTPK